jgi:hypothetical protein
MIDLSDIKSTKFEGFSDSKEEQAKEVQIIAENIEVVENTEVLQLLRNRLKGRQRSW